ncbi:MAG: acyl-CoA dehydrogenase family protein [Chloroflexi bacterium]|nr:acyl-CoA dehydrogenase family protein [Chloroflexota bacterium]
MDFAHRYSDGQERFRKEVSRWLDANLPIGLSAYETSQGEYTANWEQVEAFRLLLGEKGWLVTMDWAEGEGGDLTPANNVVLLEELNKRGVGWLLEKASASLWQAVKGWGTEAQKKRFLPALVNGHLTLWYPFMEPGTELDLSNLKVHAFRDGDDYILNGEELFAGQGLRPDYLWTIALAGPDAPSEEATATFLVPAGLEGIRIQTPKLLLPGTLHKVTFDQVRVPPYSLLGSEGEGWHLIRATLLREEVITEHPNLQEMDVAALWQYARDTTRNGTPLIKKPVLQQILVEAYINSCIARLFRMRDAWMRATGRPLTYHDYQTALQEERADMRFSEVVRDVVGIYSLLDQHDSRVPTQGRFDFQQKRSLAWQNQSGTFDVYANEIARQLGLGRSKNRRQTDSSPRGVASSPVGRDERP